MSRRSSNSSISLVVILLLKFFFYVALSTDQTNPPPPRRRNFVTKLTHYQSFHSPFYNASISASKASLIDLENSIARAAFLTTTPTTGTFLRPSGDLEAAVWARPSVGGFLAHIQVGSKLVDQLVFMDTGSGLLWINCGRGRGDSRVLGPVFVPRESSTFHIEDCSRGFCAKTGSVEVGCQGNTCVYKVRYGKGEARGFFARDSIKFGKTEDILREIWFGCTTQQTGVEETNGVLGLSNNPTSLLSQMQAPQFAYCLGNISDKDYSHNTLIIGDIDLLGPRTPIIVDDKYYLTLEAIKFGYYGKPLDFDAGILKRNTVAHTGGMILDTGSTYTFLPQVVVDKYEAEIIAVIGTSLTRHYNKFFKSPEYRRLCYDGNLFTHPLDWFPYVTFQFQGGATLELSYENLFIQLDDTTFCSVVLPSEVAEIGTVSLLGNMMQQYYYFQCDISQKLLAFYKIDCEELEQDGF